MSIKLVLGFVFFGVLSLYVAFLNPQDMELRLTQSYSLKIPVIVLLLGSILIGVLIGGLGEGLRSIRALPARYQNRRREALGRKCEKIHAEAENALIAGNLKTAATLFEKVLSLDPGHILSLNRLGDLLRQQGKPNAALEMHATAARLAPHHVLSHFGLAEDYAALNQHGKAVETLEKIRERVPDPLALLRKLRDAWLKIPDWEQAGRIQKEILRLATRADSERERRRLGEIIYGNALRCHERGDVESAQSELKRALRESKGFLSAFVTLGDIYFKANSRKDALNIWKAGFGKTQSPICLQRMRQGWDNEALKLCESAARNSSQPSRSNLALLAATVFLEKGENEKAVQILEDTAEHASLLHQVLLITARQASNHNGQLPDALQSIFRKIKLALSSYTCTQCGVSLHDWSGHCPSCQSMGRIEWDPRL